MFDGGHTPKDKAFAAVAPPVAQETAFLIETAVADHIAALPIAYTDTRTKTCATCCFHWRVGRTRVDTALRCSNKKSPYGNKFLGKFYGCSLHQAD
jgi:ribosomal protein S26